MAKLSPHDVLGVLHASLAGWTQCRIAEAFGVAQTTIGATISGEGHKNVPGAHELRLRLRIWPQRRRKLYVHVTHEMRVEIERRYYAGETRAALAAAFDLGTSTISGITGARGTRREAA